MLVSTAIKIVASVAAFWTAAIVVDPTAVEISPILALAKKEAILLIDAATASVEECIATGPCSTSLAIIQSIYSSLSLIEPPPNSIPIIFDYPFCPIVEDGNLILVALVGLFKNVRRLTIMVSILLAFSLTVWTAIMKSPASGTMIHSFDPAFMSYTFQATFGSSFVAESVTNQVVNFESNSWITSTPSSSIQSLVTPRIITSTQSTSLPTTAAPIMVKQPLVVADVEQSKLECNITAEAWVEMEVKHTIESAELTSEEEEKEDREVMDYLLSPISDSIPTPLQLESDAFISLLSSTPISANQLFIDFESAPAYTTLDYITPLSSPSPFRSIDSIRTIQMEMVGGLLEEVELPYHAVERLVYEGNNTLSTFSTQSVSSFVVQSSSPVDDIIIESESILSSPFLLSFDSLSLSSLPSPVLSTNSIIYDSALSSSSMSPCLAAISPLLLSPAVDTNEFDIPTLSLDTSLNSSPTNFSPELSAVFEGIVEEVEEVVEEELAPPQLLVTDVELESPPHSIVVVEEQQLDVPFTPWPVSELSPAPAFVTFSDSPSLLLLPVPTPSNDSFIADTNYSTSHLFVEDTRNVEGIVEEMMEDVEEEDFISAQLLIDDVEMESLPVAISSTQSLVINDQQQQLMIEVPAQPLSIEAATPLELERLVDIELPLAVMEVEMEPEQYEYSIEIMEEEGDQLAVLEVEEEQIEDNIVAGLVQPTPTSTALTAFSSYSFTFESTTTLTITNSNTVIVDMEVDTAAHSSRTIIKSTSSSARYTPYCRPYKTSPSRAITPAECITERQQQQVTATDERLQLLPPPIPSPAAYLQLLPAPEEDVIVDYEVMMAEEVFDLQVVPYNKRINFESDTKIQFIPNKRIRLMDEVLVEEAARLSERAAQKVRNLRYLAMKRWKRNPTTNRLESGQAQA